MSNNKQSSVDVILNLLVEKGYAGLLDEDEIGQVRAMHKEEHSNTWDESVDNYKKRGENDMRHWVDFDDYYNETFGGNND